jgi:hypothetical protein
MKYRIFMNVLLSLIFASIFTVFVLFLLHKVIGPLPKVFFKPFHCITLVDLFTFVITLYLYSFTDRYITDKLLNTPEYEN